MTSGGSWTNPQYVGEPVDPTGLTFTITYSDGTAPALVSPQAHTPTTWGATAGTQTCTFTYTEAGESVSCAVEATVLDSVITVVSIAVTGSEDAAQTLGEQPDFTGYTFTFGLDNGQSVVKTGAEITANNADGPTYFINYGGTAFQSGSDHPEWDWSSAQETVDIELGDYWTSEGYEIADPAPTTSITMGTHWVTSLSYSGSLTNPQYVLETEHTLGEPDYPDIPDLTGLTISAGFADGSTEVLSDFDCTVTPSQYAADGNPDNLAVQALTISYDGGMSEEVSFTISNNVTHRPDGQTLDVRREGNIYQDFPEDLWNRIKTESADCYGMAQVFQGQVNEGDWLCIWLDDSAYQNDTAVDYTTFGQWVATYGIDLTPSGTPGTAGFKPGWGMRMDGTDLSISYISLGVNGTGTATTTFNTVHTLFGKANKNITGSVKKSDLDMTNGVHYTAHIGPVDYS